ncbi:MAG TPA: hypothetical protein PKO06_07215 [Candidatus Ozemobacteraceae bacterium]|nr:hypothetical protein [Candidatus Ozemobacteraceae bacterium]
MKTRMRSILERVISYGLFAAAVGGFFFFYTNVNKAQKETIEQMRKKVLELQDLQVKADEDLKSRQRQIETVNAQIEKRRLEVKERFERLLEKAENYTHFIEQVQRKARSLDIMILTSQYEPPARAVNAPEDYQEFKFTLDVKGAYEKMKRFLWEIENALGRFVKISKLVIKPPICDADGNMSLSLTLSTFFLK